MPAFSYSAIDEAGRFVQGEIDCRHAGEVEERLKQLGFVPLETRPWSARNVTGKRGFSFRRSVRRRELTIFLRELALILRAGLTLDEALRLLASEQGAAIAAVARDLRSAITGGASLAEATQRLPLVFGPDIVAMVHVAEASGSLVGVLESIAESRVRAELLLDRISSALRYPAFLSSASICVFVFFMIVVIPQFNTIIDDAGGAPDGLAGLTLATSKWLNEHASILAASIAAGAVLLAAALSQSRIRLGAMRRLLRLPGLRGIAELRRTVLFCGSLATMLGNGVSLSETLRVMLEQAHAWSGGLEQVAGEVRRGARLADALARIRFLPEIAVRMLRVGEESGELATVAKRTAEFYDTKLARRLDALSGIIGPAAIAVIATIVGGLIVSILSALLSINRLAS
jgi:general secretion pathway protein F